MINRVEKAMALVKRENFVSLAFLDKAKDVNSAIPIGFDQNTSKPRTIKYMLELLIKDKEDLDTVIEIGTGCGYETAILANLFKKVYTIEINKELLNRAQQKLEYKNIIYIKGDAREKINTIGGKVDAIIVSTCFATIPQYFTNKLKTNGSMIIPVGNSSIQTLLKVTHKNILECGSCGFVSAQ